MQDFKGKPPEKKGNGKAPKVEEKGKERPSQKELDKLKGRSAKELVTGTAYVDYYKPQFQMHILDPDVDSKHPAECGCEFGDGGPKKSKGEPPADQIDESPKVDRTETGIEVKYNGKTAEGCSYDILCEGVAVRKDIIVAEGGETTVGLPELGCSVKIKAKTADSSDSVVDIEVKKD